MQNEVWKDIPNYEGIYQVSNLGRVKSLSRENYSGGRMKISKEIILKAGLSGKGYYSVSLHKDEKPKTFTIHQLVAIVFLNHKKDGHKLVVDHINDNPLDNRVENLQIVSNRYNTRKTQGEYSSQYKGVCWDKKRNKWKSAIYINGKTKYLGHFENENEAFLVYKKEFEIIEK